MYIIIVLNCSNDQSVAMRMMHTTSITIPEDDVAIFPLEVLYRPLVQVIDSSELPLPRFSGIAVSGPTCLSSEIWSAKDGPDFAWGLRLWLIILRPRLFVIDVVLQVPATDDILYLIFKGDVLFCCMADISVNQ